MSRKEEREQAALDRKIFWKDRQVSIQILLKGEFSTSYSWINPRFTAGKQIKDGYYHTTCGHGKTTIFTSIVYGVTFL
jgi:hypothetical protein